MLLDKAAVLTRSEIIATSWDRRPKEKSMGYSDHTKTSAEHTLRYVRGGLICTRESGLALRGTTQRPDELQSDVVKRWQKTHDEITSAKQRAKESKY